MPLTPEQVSLANDASPCYETIEREFRVKLSPSEWRELLGIVNRRLAATDGPKLVSKGWAIWDGEAMHWERAVARNHKVPTQSCEIVTFYLGEKWVPDLMVYWLAFRQLGEASPQPKSGNVTAEQYRQGVRDQFIEALRLAKRHYEPMMLPADLQNRAFAPEASMGDHDSLVEAMRQAPPPKHRRQSVEAERLWLHCTELLNALEDNGCIPHDMLIEKAIRDAFSAGQAYAELMTIADHSMLEQNKKGRIFLGGQRRLETQRMRELISEFHNKHNRVPSVHELLECGKYEIENDMIFVHDSEKDEGKWIALKAFGGRRSRAIKSVFPGPAKRGRPKGS